MAYQGRAQRSNGRRGNGLADNEDEEVFLVNMGVLALSTVLGSAGLLWLKGSAWLVEHQVLVSAAADPLLAIPGTGGAGLDVSRLAIAAAVVLIAVMGAVGGVRRAWARNRQEVS